MLHKAVSSQEEGGRKKPDELRIDIKEVEQSWALFTCTTVFRRCYRVVIYLSHRVFTVGFLM